MKLFLVGKYISGEFPNVNWEYQGIFDSEGKAVNVCINHNYFVAPVIVNEPITDETEEWPGLYYPKCKEVEA